MQQTEANAFQEQQVNIFAKYLSSINLVGDDVHPCIALTRRENFDKNDLIMIGSVIVKYFGERYVLGTRITQELEDSVAQNIDEIQWESEDGKRNFIRDLEDFANLQWSSDQVYKHFNPIVEQIESDYKNTELIKTSAVRHLQNVIRHAMFPTTQAVNIENYLSKEAWTADDLVKINTLITTVATHTGESLQYSNELYSEEAFVTALDKAVELYNEGKYAIIFMEAIQSFFERVEFYKTQYQDYRVCIGQTLDPDKFINREETEESEPQAPGQDHEEIEKNQNFKENQEEESQTPGQDRIESERVENEELIDNNPEKFIEKMIHEVTNQEEFDSTTYEKFLSGLLADEDSLPHVIQYLKAKTSQTEEGRASQTPGLGHTEFFQKFSDEILELQSKDGEEYRKIVEIVCQPIGANAKKINSYIRSVIKCLMIETNQHAQYFATQLVDDSIETWSHFQELITLIDSCKIRGSKISEYAQMFTFIENTTNYPEIREQFNKLAPIELRLEMHRILIQFMTHQPNKSEK